MITEAEPLDWVHDLKLTAAEGKIACLLLSEDRSFQGWELAFLADLKSRGSEKVLLHRLRKKLGGYHAIETKYGAGYRLRADTRQRLLTWPTPSPDPTGTISPARAA